MERAQTRCQIVQTILLENLVDCILAASPTNSSSGAKARDVSDSQCHFSKLHVIERNVRFLKCERSATIMDQQSSCCFGQSQTRVRIQPNLQSLFSCLQQPSSKLSTKIIVIYISSLFSFTSYHFAGLAHLWISYSSDLPLFPFKQFSHCVLLSLNVIYMHDFHINLLHEVKVSFLDSLFVP